MRNVRICACLLCANICSKKIAEWLSNSLGPTKFYITLIRSHQYILLIFSFAFESRDFVSSRRNRISVSLNRKEIVFSMFNELSEAWIPLCFTCWTEYETYLEFFLLQTFQFSREMNCFKTSLHDWPHFFQKVTSFSDESSICSIY